MLTPDVYPLVIPSVPNINHQRMHILMCGKGVVILYTSKEDTIMATL